MALLVDFLQSLVTPEKNDNVYSAKAHWLYLLRWIAIFGQLVVFVPGLHLGLIENHVITQYLGIVLALILLNFYSLYRGFDSIKSQSTLFLQMTIDLISLSTLLVLTKGRENPLVYIFFLNAALSPLILKGIWNNFFLLLSCVSYSFTSYSGNFFTNPSISREITIAAELCVLVIIWVLTTFLARYLFTLHSEVNRLQSQKSRIDNLRMIGALAASVSHEIATPLNTIKIRFARIARKISLEGEIEQELNSAKLAIQQCEIVLRSLLRNQSQIEFTKLSPTIISRFIERICKKWHEHHPNVFLKVLIQPESTNVYCKIPKILFTRSFLDLLNNAVQASFEQKIEIDVHIAVEDQYILINIADRGKGMEKSIKSRLGESFITNRPGGNGLGLFTTLSLLESLGGTLNVFDRKSGGTIIRLKIPITHEIPWKPVK